MVWVELIITYAVLCSFIFQLPDVTPNLTSIRQLQSKNLAQRAIDVSRFQSYFRYAQVHINCFIFLKNLLIIVRATELEGWVFANNSVIIVSATMKLDQNLVRLTP